MNLPSNIQTASAVPHEKIAKYLIDTYDIEPDRMDAICDCDRCREKNLLPDERNAILVMSDDEGIPNGKFRRLEIHPSLLKSPSGERVSFMVAATGENNEPRFFLRAPLALDRTWIWFDHDIVARLVVEQSEQMVMQMAPKEAHEEIAKQFPYPDKNPDGFAEVVRGLISNCLRDGTWILFEEDEVAKHCANRGLVKGTLLSDRRVMKHNALDGSGKEFSSSFLKISHLKNPDSHKKVIPKSVPDAIGGLLSLDSWTKRSSPRKQPLQHIQGILDEEEAAKLPNGVYRFYSLEGTDKLTGSIGTDPEGKRTVHIAQWKHQPEQGAFPWEQFSRIEAIN